ncbi:hypothetical protein [Aureibacillus halotolerans]|uniref:Uncharacterized protein n=1 Tax=Aureibacillus halotolerans TaxID=1508390 RepID=A0A4R6U461_9BACI|nr:hypothetical protein [Aureibacillus halotolerans]TDQ39225.1 hypothetical protein EV213_108177 [Aureibacillus halotolerans]
MAKQTVKIPWYSDVTYVVVNWLGKRGIINEDQALRIIKRFVSRPVLVVNSKK